MLGHFCKPTQRLNHQINNKEIGNRYGDDEIIFKEIQMDRVESLFFVREGGLWEGKGFGEQ